MRLNGKISLTWRLTLLFMLASSVVLLALGWMVASSVEKHFEQQDIEVLSGKIELVRHALQTFKSLDDLPRISQVINNSLVGHQGLELIIFGTNHKPMFSTLNSHFPLKMIAQQAAKKPYLPQTWQADTQTYRGIAAELPMGISASSRIVVAVATNIAHHQAFMRAFLQTLWLFIGGAAALTGLLGWLAVRSGLKPLHAMREQTLRVTAQQLSRRLSVESVPAELAELAQSLNDMLARLEEAFKRLSDFSSDIAHELRTPVSNLMTQTQVALSRARSADDYRSILESNAEEFERMARMISDMLLLAKADNGLVVPHLEPLNLEDEMHALFDYYDAPAEEKHITLTLQGKGTTHADRLMLRRAIGNLLSNALRHAHLGSVVRVVLQNVPDAVQLSVSNQGETIAPEHLARVFDRFFRVDSARQHYTEGAGLGLAITQSIVLAHGGTIGVTSSQGETTFCIRLPT